MSYDPRSPRNPTDRRYVVSTLRFGHASGSTRAQGTSTQCRRWMQPWLQNWYVRACGVIGVGPARLPVASGAVDAPDLLVAEVAGPRRGADGRWLGGAPGGPGSGR